jgi:uncharacterized protein YggE
LKHFLAMIAVTAITGSLFGQDIQVNRQNKTIAVTAEESATADAEIAVLEIGYHDFGLTQDAAFQENIRAAERITKALLNAKVPKGNIETEKLHLARTEIDEKWTADTKKQRQFTAEQSWHVTVSASEAQAVVDLAVKAGANEVEDVQWDVADPVALQGKASGAALAKARSIADQMAKGLGTKLGELVYASNRAPAARILRGWEGGLTETVMVTGTKEKQASLTLFPQQVKSGATVYAVFSIE